MVLLGVCEMGVDPYPDRLAVSFARRSDIHSSPSTS